MKKQAKEECSRKYQEINNENDFEPLHFLCVAFDLNLKSKNRSKTRRIENTDILHKLKYFHVLRNLLIDNSSQKNFCLIGQ